MLRLTDNFCHHRDWGRLFTRDSSHTPSPPPPLPPLPPACPERSLCDWQKRIIRFQLTSSQHYAYKAVSETVWWAQSEIFWNDPNLVCPQQTTKCIACTQFVYEHEKYGIVI